MVRYDIAHLFTLLAAARALAEMHEWPQYMLHHFADHTKRFGVDT